MKIDIYQRQRKMQLTISRSGDLGRRSAETDISCTLVAGHAARRAQLESFKPTIVCLRSVDGSGTFAGDANSARARRVWSIRHGTKGSGPVVVVGIHGGVGRCHGLGRRAQRDDLCHFLVLSAFLLADKRTGSRALTLVVVMPNKRAEMRVGAIVSSRREVEDATAANYKKQ